MIIKIDTEKETVEIIPQDSDIVVGNRKILKNVVNLLSVAASTISIKNITTKEAQYKFADIINMITKTIIDREHEKSDSSETEKSDFSETEIHIISFEDSEDNYKEI